MKVVMRTYVKKPVEVQAVEWNGDNDVYDFLHKWSNSTIIRQTRNVLSIATLEGVMEVRIGDYVIRGVKGEFYPCKPDIFELTYQLPDWEKERDGDMWPELPKCVNCGEHHAVDDPRYDCPLAVHDIVDSIAVSEHAGDGMVLIQDIRHSNA